jgi:hydrogenase nickel incorporation protein HypB
MCKECGCSEVKIIDKSIKDNNDKIAHKVWHKLDDLGVFCINLLGAPGAGKTTLIKGISRIIGSEKIAVIQGDLESDIDTKLLTTSGIDSYQINTHSGCHLNADMVNEAVSELNKKGQLNGKDYLIIENVGNLVCPSGVNLGQSINIVVSSTAEGNDKPQKYPLIFLDAFISVISKYDLKEYVDFDESAFIESLKNLNPNINIIKTSKNDPDSYLELVKVLREVKAKKRSHKH